MLDRLTETTHEDFRDFVAARLHAPNGTGPRSDYDLNPGMRADAPETLTAAAVLVPLVMHPAGATLLLTQRTDHLHDHASQVSFPGGRIEESDADAVAAALRETEEEVGLDRRHVDLIGRLGVHDTGTGYRVLPVVGLVVPPFDLTLEPTEVEEVFEVPLDFVMEPVNHGVETRLHRGKEREFPILPWGDYFIWGLTARLLRELSMVLKG